MAYGEVVLITGGAGFIGRSVPVTVSRMHQTLAGKMVFGTVKIPHTKPGTAANVTNHKKAESPTPAKKSILSRLSR
jgi:hypothetical protein